MKASVEEVCKSALQQHTQGFLVSALQKRFDASHDTLPTKAQSGLCVAYSGGLDSTVLLHIAESFCQQANISLMAVHVNHGISKHANAWQLHCQTQCARRSIPFHSQSLSLKKTPQRSLEADARDARYRVIDEFAGLHKIVLLAQHQNDQAETFLIQLKRGAGIQGLASMPTFITRVSGVQYLRPLLDVERSDILQYAQQKKLEWVEDESNQDASYDRNFLRTKVFPLLTNRWPSFNKTVARSARHCAQANAVNAEYMHLLRQRLTDKSCIIISELNQLSAATKECFVRYYLSNEYGLSPTSAQLSDILRMTDVINAQSEPIAYKASKNASPHFILSNYVIERFRDKLLVTALGPQKQISPLSTVLTGPFSIEWGMHSHIILNESYALHKVDCHSASKPNVFLLPRNGVEYVFGGSNISFKYNANRPNKSLKKWYQEWGVSPIQRQQTPVFIYNNKAIVIGLENIKESALVLENTIYVELRKSEPI